MLKNDWCIFIMCDIDLEDFADWIDDNVHLLAFMLELFMDNVQDISKAV